MLAAIFSILEVNVAIVCASLLVMKPLMVRLFPRVLGEQPCSAREEKRMLRAATGVHHLGDETSDAEQGSNGDGHNDESTSVPPFTRAAITGRLICAPKRQRPYSWPLSRPKRLGVVQPQ